MYLSHHFILDKLCEVTIFSWTDNLLHGLHIFLCTNYKGYTLYFISRKVNYVKFFFCLKSFFLSDCVLCKITPLLLGDSWCSGYSLLFALNYKYRSNLMHCEFFIFLINNKIVASSD